jgi:hypothetical protein
VHGDEGVTMLSNEPLEGKVALPLPFSRINNFSCRLSSASHLSLPAYWLDKACQASLPFFVLWNGLIDAAYEVALVASSSLLYISELSSVNNTCP